MNHIEARVRHIEETDNITIISFDAQGQPLRMMALGLNLPLRVGTHVILGFKASHVSLAKELTGSFSISNRIQAVIETVETGALLCSVRLRVGPTFIESIITRESADRMELKAGDAVTALVKASDVSVVEIV